MPPEVEKNLTKSYGTAIKYFDRLEDRVRHALSQRPLLYALIAGIAIVMFWRGVWLIIDILPLLHYPLISFIISVFVLLITGTFVSFFIGDEILLSGLKHEKRIAEKTEKDIAQEETELTKIFGRLHLIEKDIREITELLQKKSTPRKTPKKDSVASEVI